MIFIKSNELKMHNPSTVSKRTSSIAALCMLIAISGCSTYTTPGAGVSVGNLSAADADIGEVLKREPAATFPGRLAVARLQASGYYSRSSGNCYGSGNYCVLTARDIETEKDFERLANTPMASDIALVSRVILPAKLETTKELRLAAASLKTDLLLVYSVSTGFNIENTDIGPLAMLSLGFLPTKKARVTSTASAAVYDVRTGFLYGVTEATAVEEQRGTFWSSSEAVDSARIRAEAEAFKKLIGEVELLSAHIVRQHGQKTQAATSN